jgi:hypothetical protein
MLYLGIFVKFYWNFMIHKRNLAPIDGIVYKLKIGISTTGSHQAGTAYSEFA